MERIERIRRGIAAALGLAILLTTGLAVSQPAAAAGPYLPDLAIVEGCLIQGPEGPPRIRLKIANIGNDVATNRVAISLRGILGQSGFYSVQHPTQAVTLQPGQAFSVTITFSNRAHDLEARVRLFYVKGGLSKPMEEHTLSNNVLPFDYPGLAFCQ
jgi:FtsP/CotA-like multicopper oxidase with cupredoxin domain